MRTALAVLLFSFLAAGCGSDNAPEQLPQFSPPLGEPSPIVRGFFDLQDSSCETDGSQLRIAQNVQEVWLKGGFDYGQRASWGGWELGGSVDDENTVRFEIEGRNTTLICTATLLEPVFQGTCESTTSGSDFLGIGTCDFVFSRGAPREGVGEGNDQDGDGVVDGEDNCPSVANVDQGDTDGDGRGDACESVGCPASSPDAAALVPPLDTDEDGTVDECDDDIDGDGIPNAEDNCRNVSNPDQADSDDDGIGDFCEEFICPLTGKVPGEEFVEGKLYLEFVSSIGSSAEARGIVEEHDATYLGDPNPLAPGQAAIVSFEAGEECPMIAEFLSDERINDVCYGVGGGNTIADTLLYCAGLEWGELLNRDPDDL